MLQKNIQLMNHSESGFDVIVICCSSEKQARFWQSRLLDGRGSVLPSKAMVLAVDEDWPGGAGNGRDTSMLMKLQPGYPR